MTPGAHTPGPWRVWFWLADPDDPASKMRFVEGSGTPNPHSLRVADVATGDVTDEVEEANARLIAAAPKMLAALRPFANYACDPVGSCEEDGERCHNCIAHDAVAEATGGAS